MTDRELICEAMEARKMAYTPYSHFQVGAALLAADGRVFRGCNIENAAYSPTNCAERTAFFKAISEGARHFTSLALVAAPEGASLQYTAPCGVCRQVMMEFCNPDTFRILMAVSPEEYRVYTLRQLMPESFGPADL